MSSPSTPPSRWENKGSKLLLHTRIFDVHSTHFHHPRRKTDRDFVVVTPPDWVNVVAHTRDDQIVLIRQFRYGIDAFSLEIPGGVIEPGEDPVVAGLRELQEETGYTAKTARLLASVHPNPAMQSNRCHLVLAEDAECTHPHGWDEDEEIQLCVTPAEEVFRLARSGGITHTMVLNALFLYQPLWREKTGRRA